MNRDNINDIWSQYNVYLQLLITIDDVERKINQILPFTNSIILDIDITIQNIRYSIPSRLLSL
ncbi:hypothetical protein IKO50_07385 [bacterium]|nr:hypothetical protein [bacterium]